jgi:vacuolar iron transporter family protein
VNNNLELIARTKKRLELKGQTRDFVFGIQDGLISILGLIAGVYGAYANQPTIIIVVGITGAIAAAISMAVGSLLSKEAERDILLAEIDTIKKEFIKAPFIAQESLVHELEKSGLDKPSAFNVVKLLSNQETSLFNNFRAMVLDLPSYEGTNPWINATVMFFAFIFGALFPIVPFLIWHGQIAFIISIVITGAALFIMGVLKGLFSKASILKSGAKFFFIAVLAGVLSELIGTYVSIAFGV